MQRKRSEIQSKNWIYTITTHLTSSAELDISLIPSLTKREEHRLRIGVKEQDMMPSGLYNAPLGQMVHWSPSLPFLYLSTDVCIYICTWIVNDICVGHVLLRSELVSVMTFRKLHAVLMLLPIKLWGAILSPETPWRWYTFLISRAASSRLQRKR